LSWSELRAAYAEHDAFLFTSLRDSFGSQVVEAMAMGLPVITLDLHGAHDFVPANASMKVRVSNPEETLDRLVASINEYIALPARKKNEMSSSAWNFAKTLSWSARAAFVEDLYRQVWPQTKVSGLQRAPKLSRASAYPQLGGR
jgi:glycosyltransferase involved in cell wall biosynthesis